MRLIFPFSNPFFCMMVCKAPRYRTLFFSVLLLIALIASIPLKAAKPAIAIGDWVLRTGIGQESDLIRQLSNSQFSHIGMVVQTTPTIQIIHATTSDNPQTPDQVILSSFEQFTSSKHAFGFAVIRPLFMTATQKQEAAEFLYQQLGKPFVLVPRQRNPRYCTTIILDAILASGVKIHPHWQHSDFLLLEGDYLFPQAFIELPDILWITLYVPVSRAQ